MTARVLICGCNRRADVSINFYFATVLPRTICELQIVHKDLVVARVECRGHDAYASFRTAQELLVSAGAADVESETARQKRLDKHARQLKRGFRHLVDPVLSPKASFVEHEM